MDTKTTIPTPLLLVFIAGIIIVSGIPKKIEYTLQGEYYNIVCHVKGGDDCDAVREYAKKIQVKPFEDKIDDKDKLVLSYIKDNIFYIHIFIIIVLLVLIYPENVKRVEFTTIKNPNPVGVPEIFSSHLQVAVINLYKIGFSLSKKDIETLKQIQSEYIRLACLMLIARKRFNFAAREVADGIEDTLARKIIFSAGRPSIPPSVLPFYLSAENYISP